MAENLDDLLAQLPRVEGQFAEITQRYTQRAQKLQERMRRDPNFIAPPDYLRPPQDAATAEAGYAYIERLSRAYIQSDDAGRLRARGLVANHPNVRSRIPIFVENTTKAIPRQPAAAGERLRVALAALSLEDATYYPGLSPRWQEDYRNVYASLDPLLEAAKAADVDVLSALRTAAVQSSDQPSWVTPTSPSLRSVLQEKATAFEKDSLKTPPPLECPEVSPIGIPALPLTNGQAVSGQITRGGSIVVYQFQARRADAVTITMQRTGGQYEPFVALADISGGILIRGGINRYVIPDDGCYYVYASCKETDAEGTFSLIVRWE